jgi:hypothetical protein
MYADLARTVILGEDEDRLEHEIREILAKHPGADRSEVADRLVARAMVRSGAVGAIAALPAGVLAGLPVAADMAYQVRSLSRLALVIARVKRRETSPLDRAAAAVGALALAGAAGVLRSALISGARQAFGRRAPKLVPVAGALAGAASGALAAWVAGRLTREALARR